MRTHAPQSRQTGAVLIIVLVMLLVLTILGVSSLTTSSLEQKMAGNSRDRHIAFQAAEAALSYGEDFITSSINAQSAFTNTNGFYKENDGPASYNAFDSSWWTGTNSIVYPTSIVEVNTAPRYTIELYATVEADENTSINLGGYGESTGGGAITAFRVTARGTGLSDNTQVILTSYYGKRL
jgi:type IV pilus assembly protein PilX